MYTLYWCRIPCRGITLYILYHHFVYTSIFGTCVSPVTLSLESCGGFWLAPNSRNNRFYGPTVDLGGTLAPSWCSGWLLSGGAWGGRRAGWLISRLVCRAAEWRGYRGKYDGFDHLSNCQYEQPTTKHKHHQPASQPAQTNARHGSTIQCRAARTAVRLRSLHVKGFVSLNSGFPHPPLLLPLTPPGPPIAAALSPLGVDGPAEGREHGRR